MAAAKKAADKKDRKVKKAAAKKADAKQAAAAKRVVADATDKVCEYTTMLCPLDSEMLTILVSPIIHVLLLVAACMRLLCPQTDYAAAAS